MTCRAMIVELYFDWHDSKLKASNELDIDPIGLIVTTLILLDT